MLNKGDVIWVIDDGEEYQPFVNSSISEEEIKTREFYSNYFDVNKYVHYFDSKHFKNAFKQLSRRGPVEVIDILDSEVFPIMKGYCLDSNSTNKFALLKDSFGFVYLINITKTPEEQFLLFEPMELWNDD